MHARQEPSSVFVSSKRNRSNSGDEAFRTAPIVTLVAPSAVSRVHHQPPPKPGEGAVQAQNFLVVE